MHFFAAKEQIEVSLAIARALNGKFNIVCVDGIEKLDDESFNAFCQMMEGDPETVFRDAGWQSWRWWCDSGRWDSQGTCN